MRQKDCRRPHGSVIDHNGYWYLFVRLPGQEKRRKYPLCAPGSDRAMRSDRPKEMAIEAAHRVWEEATRQNRIAPTTSMTVDDLCAKFCDYAEVYYRGGSEADNCRVAVRTFRELYGNRPVAELLHADMMAVRDAMVRRDLARVTVNRYMRIITHRLVPWALDESYIRAAVAAELSQVRPLKRNRCTAREMPPVRPVSDGDVEATLPFMMPNTADMVRVHRLTGMRPEEICALTWDQIDESRTPWVYRPAHHKNEWRGQPRVVLIGPRAREILERHRCAGHPFSPVEAVAEWMREKREKRTSPFYPCRDESYSRADPHAQRKPREAWDTQGYWMSIRKACARANVGQWRPNQLRHAFGTAIRRAYGLDAARAALGHSHGACVTDRYSFEALEDELVARASAAVEAMG
jgi:integrase